MYKIMAAHDRPSMGRGLFLEADRKTERSSYWIVRLTVVQERADECLN
jgi:hypothetical protein